MEVNKCFYKYIQYSYMFFFFGFLCRYTENSKNNEATVDSNKTLLIYKTISDFRMSCIVGMGFRIEQYKC